MIRMGLTGSCVILSLTLTACDQPNRSVTAPTVVTGLTMRGPDAMLTGKSLPYDALNSSTGHKVQATWTSSDPSVATVEGNGLVTALQQGSTRLEASFQDVTASRIVEVVNNFEGKWSGWATVRHCEVTGGFVHDWLPICSKAHVGWQYLVDLRLSHSSDDVRQVTGAYYSQGLAGVIFGHCDVPRTEVPLTGHISNDGHLTLTGAIAAVDGSERWTVAGWDTFINAPGEMRGRWAQDLTVPSGTRYWEVEVELKATKQGPCDLPF
jgi:hypothetical protein